MCVCMYAHIMHACMYKLYRSGCLAVHWLVTVHRLIRVGVSAGVKFRVRDMDTLKVMDHG